MINSLIYSIKSQHVRYNPILWSSSRFSVRLRFELLSVSDEVHKWNRENASSGWIPFNVAHLKNTAHCERRASGKTLGEMCQESDCLTYPPLLVFLSIYYDHLSLSEGKLIWVISHTLVDSFHPLQFIFLPHTETQLDDGVMFCPLLYLTLNVLKENCTPFDA